MLEIAKSLGYICVERRGLEMDLAQHIFSRMTNRLGKAIYQVIEFGMSFPRHAAQMLFPSHLLHNEAAEVTAATMSWSSTTMAEASELMSDLLSRVSTCASGLTRAVQP